MYALKLGSLAEKRNQNAWPAERPYISTRNTCNKT